MSETIQIASNPIVAKLLNASDDVRLGVSELLSFYVDGYEHMEAFQEKRWDGRSTFFEYLPARFPAGFSASVQQWLHQRGYNVQLIKHPLPPALGELPTPDNPIVDSFAHDERYDYQFKAINLLEKYGSYIARVATGGGKTRISKLCIQRIGRKALFITTRTALLHQFAEECIASGMRVSMIGDSEYDASGDIVCGMVQTLAQRLKEPEESDHSEAASSQRIRVTETKAFLESIEFVIAEEAHESSGNQYNDVLRWTRKAHYRLALTATPMMRGVESNMRLLGSFGPVRLEISEKMLIDRGILAKPYFKFLNTKAPTTVRRSTAWMKAMDLGIVQNPDRNKAICFEAIRASRYGLPVVMLVTRKRHGDILQRILKAAGIRAEFIFGDTSQVKRKKALDRLANGQLQVVIGTTIIDVGVDVPALSMVILAGGGKAEVATRQRIGRTLREKKKGPNVAFVIEFSDKFNKHTASHAATRRAIIEATDGFHQGIIPSGDDFDYEALGFTRLVSKAA